MDIADLVQERQEREDAMRFTLAALGYRAGPNPSTGAMIAGVARCMTVLRGDRPTQTAALISVSRRGRPRGGDLVRYDEQVTP